MSIKSLIKKKEPTALLQAEVERGLYDDLRKALKKNKITIRAFTEASARQFLSEIKSVKN